MTTATVRIPAQRAPELLGQTVVVIGGSAGIGLETARHARAEGAEIILTARDSERLKDAANDLGAVRSAAFDAGDSDSLAGFFNSLSGPIDHVMVGGAGPRYGRPLEMDAEEARRAFSGRLMLVLGVAQHAVGKVRPGGSLVFLGGTGGRRIAPGYEIVAAVTAALPALTATLALDLAPIRVNLIAPGFVDTPLSARLLGDGLEARRAELRTKLPIGRWWNRRTSPRSLCTSWSTPPSPGRPTTSTAANSSSRERDVPPQGAEDDHVLVGSSSLNPLPQTHE